MAQVLTETEDFFQDYQHVLDGESRSGSNPEYEAWFRRNVEAGLQDIREGRVVSHEQIQADALQRREKLHAARA